MPRAHKQKPARRSLSARARHCAETLSLAARLADSALARHDPEFAAEYVVGAVADLAAELRELRRGLRARRATAS